MNFLNELVSVICIDDTHKPDAIKTFNWIKKDHPYTVIATVHHPITNTLGFKLAEVDTCCPEYPTYRSTRFAIKSEDLHKLFKVQEEVNVEEFLKEVEAI